MIKTLRMIFPQWQGGENFGYSFGSKILNFISPDDPEAKTVEVPIELDTTAKNNEEYFGKESLIKQQLLAKEILDNEEPEKVIIYGGDCSVSQAPFDYLHSKYPENTGVLWIDAHPDISTPETTNHEHAMVLGNLLGEGAEELAELVENTFEPKDILYIGLNTKDILEYEKDYLNKKDIRFLTNEEIKEDSTKIIKWIQDNNLKQVIIHLDVDVLDPKDFKSQLTQRPNFGPINFALGTLSLDRIFEVLRNIQDETEIVGLAIAEFLPWDLIRLSEEMKRLKIFTE